MPDWYRIREFLGEYGIFIAFPVVLIVLGLVRGWDAAIDALKVIGMIALMCISFGVWGWILMLAAKALSERLNLRDRIEPQLAVLIGAVMMLSLCGIWYVLVWRSLSDGGLWSRLVALFILPMFLAPGVALFGVKSRRP